MAVTEVLKAQIEVRSAAGRILECVLLVWRMKLQLVMIEWNVGCLKRSVAVTIYQKAKEANENTVGTRQGNIPLYSGQISSSNTYGTICNGISSTGMKLAIWKPGAEQSH